MIAPDIEPIVASTRRAAGMRSSRCCRTSRKRGYLSRDAVVRIGQHLRLPASKVYGVATFYNQFRFQPLGRYHIQVCRGTACHVKKLAADADGDPAHAEASSPARRRATGSSASRWWPASAPAAWRR